MRFFQRKTAEGADISHPWSGVGADEYFATTDYETPPGGEWFISYAEPFDLDPGVKNLSELDCLDAASARLKARAAAGTVSELVVSVESLGMTRAERIQRSSELLIAAMQRARVA